LALCDSPEKSVRAYGREFVERRLSTLPRDLLLRRLFENPDPAMQAFVASLLLKEGNDTATTPEFDEAVLRARGRGRRAKELVKQRIGQQRTNALAAGTTAAGTTAAGTTADVATLLEMARSCTPRDAEWALSQLARLAAQGREIEGFTVEGVSEV